MQLTKEQSGRILLVEDEPDTRTLLSELLEYYGFQVDSVATVPLALERLEHDCYQIVLTDYVTGRLCDAERDAHALLDAAAPGPAACLTGWSPVPESLIKRFAFVTRKPFGSESLLADIAQVMKSPPRPDDAEKVLRYFDALTRKDWDGLVALCSEDVAYRVTGHHPELSQEVVGRKGLKELSARAFEAYPDASFEVRELVSLPKGAVARYRGQWSSPHDKPVSFEAVVAFGFSQDYIAQISVRMDMERLNQLQQDTFNT